MNEDIMKAVGFGKEIEARKKGLCPFCEKPIGKFRDELSIQECRISGLCQQCQDEIFGEG